MASPKLWTMRGDYRKAGAWVAGSGVTLAGLYLISSASSGHKTPSFPYWIFLALFVIGGCVYLSSALQARIRARAAESAGELPTSDEPSRAEPVTNDPGRATGVTLTTDPDTISDANMPRLARTVEPVVTGHWRYTQVGFEVSTLANIGTKGFSHPAYRRQAEETPPAVRTGMLVACSPLGDEPTAEVLRSRFRLLLSESFRETIAELTDIRPGTRWQSQPGRGRFNLEADLTGDDQGEVPVASALLLVPVAGQSFYGRDPHCAELVVHVDLPVKDGVPLIADLPEWHRRFSMALALPGTLARFLQDLGLTAFDDPPVKFSVQVQARPLTAGMSEIFDIRHLTPISGGRTSVQFDGWAVADPGGKTAGVVAKSFIRQMCEDMGQEGYEETLTGLPE
jgi:hypothetical protein